jgi:kinetochore protein Spc7/SPC105
MSMDDLTARSSATMQSDISSSSSSSARLNDALRQAAKEAGTQAIDDTGEISMEIADQEITGAFKPWIQKGQRQSFDWDDLSARHDQENVDPSKAASTQDFPASDDMDEDEDLSMDVTNVVGGILGRATGRRQSAVSRKSLGQETNYGDQTMEMTGMVGGIASMESPAKPFDENNEDEEMTMEFTSVVGGVLNKGQSLQQGDDTNMEAPGSYTPKSDRMSMDGDDASDEGMEMEITGAVGGILPSGLETPDKAQAKRIMELETESGQLGSSPFQEDAHQSPPKSPAKSPLVLQVATVASENGSPSLASVQPRRSSRRSSILGPSRTPELASHQQSALAKPTTPSKQLTPQPRPTTPSKTPPSANVTFRSASPKKLFKPEIKQSTEKQKSSRPSIFEQDISTGLSTPRIILQPREGRRSSGLGIDKEGLGSPRVAALLDKRLSLSENTPQFVPQERPRVGGVRFEDPLKMQADEEREREEEELREDGHIPLVNPVTLDPTSSLKNLISRMSPKKGKVGNRKSLHVGAARGILGKRPAELDSEEEEAENSPKRLRGHTVSPVKGVRLPGPSHDSRPIRSPVRRARSSSPLKGSTTPTQEPTGLSNNGTTPLKKGIDALHLASDSQQPQEEEAEAAVEDQAEDVEPIQLQDFLNMTNIHFMELTTTKRRHTTAPGSATRRLSRASSENVVKQGVITFDDCVAAGFCTVPMLELYQHASYSDTYRAS